MCLKKIGLATCSKHANHSMFDSQGDLGDLCDHSMSTSIFTLILIKKFMMTSKFMKQMVVGII